MYTLHTLLRIRQLIFEQAHTLVFAWIIAEIFQIS